MTKDGIGAYEKLLNTLGMELDDPYWERERGIRKLINQLEAVKDMGEYWWDGFMESHDIWTAIEESCFYTQQMETHYDSGYESGQENAYGYIDEDRTERTDDWLDKLFNFLKDKWVNLNKKQIQEVEDFIEAYPIPE